MERRRHTESVAVETTTAMYAFTRGHPVYQSMFARQPFLQGIEWRRVAARKYPARAISCDTTLASSLVAKFDIYFETRKPNPAPKPSDYEHRTAFEMATHRHRFEEKIRQGLHESDGPEVTWLHDAWRVHEENLRRADAHLPFIFPTIHPVASYEQPQAERAEIKKTQRQISNKPDVPRDDGDHPDLFGNDR